MGDGATEADVVEVEVGIGGLGNDEAVVLNNGAASESVLEALCSMYH